MATIITRTLLCLALSLFFAGCKPQPKKRALAWPFADTNVVVTYKKVTRPATSGGLQPGLQILSSNQMTYALSYGTYDSKRNHILANTNTTVWLVEQGQYAFPARGELTQGASLRLGSIGENQIIFHIEQQEGSGLRIMHLLYHESLVFKERIEPATLGKIGEPEIEKLIGDLSSKNLDPARFGWETGIPVNYDLEAQKRVWRAENTLSQLGFKAFPALIRHIKDKEYCKSNESSELYSYSVGQVSARIINQQINIAGEPHRYQDRKGSKIMWDRPFVWIDHYNAETWWSANNHRTLEEVQLDSVNYVITNEKALGFINAEQEKKVLEPLEEIRQRLLKKIADNAKR